MDIYLLLLILVVAVVMVMTYVVWFIIIPSTRKCEGKWGFNLQPVTCSACGISISQIRKPTNMRQFLWGGGTCPKCKVELDKWGKQINNETAT